MRIIICSFTNQKVLLIFPVLILHLFYYYFLFPHFEISLD